MAKKELTPEERDLLNIIDQMKEEFNGCPLFEDRERGQLDDLTGETLTIEDIYPIEDYHAIVFENHPSAVYLTGGALKDLCNNYPKHVVVGRTIILQEKVKTKKNREFRPITIVS